MDVFDVSLPLLTRRDQDATRNLIDFLVSTDRIYSFAATGDSAGLIVVFPGGPRTYTKPHALLSDLLAHTEFGLRIIGGRGEPILPAPGSGPSNLIGGLILNHAHEFPRIDHMYRGWALVDVAGRLTPAKEAAGVQLTSTPPDPKYASDDFEHLHNLFSGVYCTHAARARLLVHTILMAARAALNDFPILVLDGPKKGVGKTRTALAIATLYGCADNVLTYTANEDKLEFSLGDFTCRSGPTVIVFDNVRGKRGRGSSHQIRGQVISACVNSPRVLVAGKYKSLAPLQHPCLVFTMNRAEIEHDLHDKCTAVRLHGAGEFAYMEPCPLLYAREFREAILDEVHALLAGLPLSLPKKPVTRFGHYEYLAGEVARKLDLDLDLRASAATLDSLAVELSNLLDDYRSEHDDWPTIIEATRMLRTRRNMVELNEVLDRAKRGTVRAEAEALAEFVATSLDGRGFRIDGKGPIRRICTDGK